MYRKNFLIIKREDNVGTAVENLKRGESIEFFINDKKKTIKLIDDVPFGHKFSLEYIKSGSRIIKYNETIGIASNDIEEGQWVHIHNIESTRARGDLKK